MQYDFETQDLSVKLRSGLAHEVLHTDLLRAIDAKITAMGLD